MTNYKINKRFLVIISLVCSFFEETQGIYSLKIGEENLSSNIK